MAGQKSIRISPKYGVNPTIPCCFFCGKDKNEIALLGKIGGRGQDLEAPRRMVLDYEPCDECKSNMEKGIALIGVDTNQPADGRPPIQHSDEYLLYPTGRWAVVTEEAAKRLFDADDDDAIIKQRKAFVNDEYLAHLQASA